MVLDAAAYICGDEVAYNSKNICIAITHAFSNSCKEILIANVYFIICQII